MVVDKKPDPCRAEVQRTTFVRKKITKGFSKEYDQATFIVMHANYVKKHKKRPKSKFELSELPRIPLAIRTKKNQEWYNSNEQEAEQAESFSKDIAMPVNFVQSLVPTTKLKNRRQRTVS